MQLGQLEPEPDGRATVVDNYGVLPEMTTDATVQVPSNSHWLVQPSADTRLRISAVLEALERAAVRALLMDPSFIVVLTNAPQTGPDDIPFDAAAQEEVRMARVQLIRDSGRHLQGVLREIEENENASAEFQELANRFLD